MPVNCPKCRASYEVTAFESGQVVRCPCGEVLAVPKTRSGRRLLFILAAVLVVVGVCAPMTRNFLQYNLRAKAGEASVNLRAIAEAEVAHFQDHGAFVIASPVPSAPGRMQKVAFVPDPGFEALGWRPEGNIYFQYEVKLTGPTSATAIARGDIDADDQPSEFRIRFDASGAISQVENVHPGQY